MPRPIRATVHSDALAHNLALARRAAGDAKVWAVVKADAYGHGIERVFDALRAADGFALLDLADAQRVRALGWRGPILLLEGAFELRDLELCSAARPLARRSLHRADRHAGNPQNPGAAPGVSGNELRHEPVGPAASSLPGGLDEVEPSCPRSMRSHS